jgi:hypothetical protein
MALAYSIHFAYVNYLNAYLEYGAFSYRPPEMSEIVLAAGLVTFDTNVAILTIFPVALTLANGQFFTVILSFGGLFWLLMFPLFKPPLPSGPGTQP